MVNNAALLCVNWPLPCPAYALYIDLQYGDTSQLRAALREFPDFILHHDPIIDQMHDLDGFALQVAACDMVVSIGNTTAHMAAGLAFPASSSSARCRADGTGSGIERIPRGIRGLNSQENK